MHDLNPLAIAKIKINPALRSDVGTANSKSKKGTEADVNKLPESLQRAGAYLMNMLKVEYQTKAQPIEGLAAIDALNRLKEQLRKFTKSVYPFDKRVDKADGPREWWKRLDEDKSLDRLEAQPLAVSNPVVYCLLIPLLIHRHSDLPMHYLQ